MKSATVNFHYAGIAVPATVTVAPEKGRVRVAGAINVKSARGTITPDEAREVARMLQEAATAAELDRAHGAYAGK